jgi:anti-sigma B factor antagonist
VGKVGLAPGSRMPDHSFDSSHPRIEEERLDDVEVFVLGGEFDAFSSPQLEAALMGAIERGGYQIVVDLTAVTFLDMSTIYAIVRAVKGVYQHNGHLVVVSDSGPVLRIIDLAGMRHAIHLQPTREEALAELRRPRPAAV